jgi:hypothetical protein
MLGNLASAISGAMGGGGGGGAGIGGGSGSGVGGLLGTLLGGHHDTVAQGVGQATGLEPDKSKRLLMILAPIVLAALARRHGNSNDNSAPAGSLGTALQQDAQVAQQNSPPHLGGILGSILSRVQTPGA